MPDASANSPAGQSSPGFSLDPTQVKIAQRLEALKTSESGLTSAEAARRSPNTAATRSRTGRKANGAACLKYFWGPLPFLIEAAAVISGVRKDWPDFGVVTGLLIYNAVVGFWQDNKAANALAALKKNLAPRARVLRDGAWTTIAAAELTPGDIVSVAAGQIIPADLLLIEGDYLSCDRAALTGKSLPVSKKIGDDAYSGAIAKQGAMSGVVTATGDRTFFGRTAKLVAAAGAVSHSQRAVTEVGDFLLLLAFVLALVLVGAQRYRAVIAPDVWSWDRRLDRAICARSVNCIHSGRVAGGHVGDHGDRRLHAVIAEGDCVAPLRDRGARRRRCAVQRQDRHADDEPADGQDAIPFGSFKRDDVLRDAALATQRSSEDAIDLAVMAALPAHDALDGFKQKAFTPFGPSRQQTHDRHGRRRRRRDPSLRERRAAGDLRPRPRPNFADAAALSQ